jgi:hypothetical protein
LTGLRNHKIFLVRLFLILTGSFAILWGLVTLPVFWEQSAIEKTAKQIIRGEQFKLEALKSEMPLIDSIDGSTHCRPAGIQSAAIVRLGIAEEAIASGDRQFIDLQLKASDRQIRDSLSCSPADSFLWLALFWVDNNLSGLRPSYFQYLRMSYEVGPNEGWVALRRNYLAFSIFDHLPSDLADKAMREFVGLVDAQLYSETAEIFVGPAWHVRDEILSRLAEVEPKNRQAFADVLNAQGVDVAVPGTQPPHNGR